MNHNLIRPFLIDDGQLDGLTPQHVFVLGYELAQLDRLIDRYPGRFIRLFHADNLERLRWKLDRSGRGYQIRFMHNDISEDWVVLSVREKS